MNKKVDMLISTLNRIKDVSLKFKNPSFNHYFSKKAEDCLEMVNNKRENLTEEDVEKLINEYSELENVLNRQTTVQNLYYSDKTDVDK
ncbi:hypothetical protein TpMuguga_01g00402 [Theileria parva strain Muguga]|uniref:Uncharacterized protein n=1 Tax=Theileria parva TaxID=5875 RepID=Q4N8R2_THEPA|nr:uncharacterized protein TpMuguga_01g00402 [Theileria parva strain Muguga]EAN33646.1 hypothetical protein TpMuguga_01g00402 [Theileria parva strain Muguga]|eukprot:XP_765929.1 hypothetical protein [Theileria parva strain Muguga]